MDPASVVDTMSTEAWLALVIPIIFTTLIGPWLAYKFAVKSADRKAKADKELANETAKTEHRRMDLAEWQAMTADLRQEIQRLRQAREEDDRKFEEAEAEADALRSEVREHRTGCVRDVQRLQDQIRALTNWERQVWSALNDPGIYRILEAGGFKLPPPPIMLATGATVSPLTRQAAEDVS